jgi:hypothetical protein
MHVLLVIFLVVNNFGGLGLNLCFYNFVTIIRIISIGINIDELNRHPEFSG